MTLQVGRLTLDDPESLDEQGSRDHRMVTLSGSEMTGDLTDDEILRLRQEILAMGDLAVVTWTEDDRLDGWWNVEGVDAELRSRASGAVMVVWSLQLVRIGNESELEFESHLVGADLQTAHAVTPKRFHAAPSTGYGYRTGGALPSKLNRSGSDGTVTVFLDVGDVHPIWGVAPGGWYDGGCTITVDGTVVAGRQAPNSPSGWQIDNTLVRVTPNGTGIDVASWDGGWETITWELHIDGVQVGSWDAFTVLHNTADRVTVRLSRSGMTWDLTLRRGSRFVTCVVKRDVAATVKIVRATAEAADTFEGGIRASANDADGNKYSLMSAKDFTADTVNGGIELTATVFPFAVGADVGGTSAAVGDRSAELVQQYFAYLSETVRPRPR